MVDCLSTIKTIISDNFTAANCDSITPVIDFVTSYKQLDLANNDYVLLYIVSEEYDRFGLGGNSFKEESVVAIDIRTTYKVAAISDVRAHLVKIKDEVKRILKSKLSKPDSTFQLLEHDRMRDLSDKSVGLGRMVIECTLKYFGT